MGAATRGKKRAAPSITEVKQLKELDNATIQAVTDLVNNFRDMGLNQDLDVPSTVVVGDTSAGKSSVMSRLTGLPFPSGTGIKTIFITEVIMKRSKDELITVEVLSGEASSSNGVDTLQRPRKIDLEDFAGEFDKAAAELRAANKSSQVLFDGILRIQLQGPTCPPLTVIDLPGHMHAGKMGVTDADVKLSQTLINRYIKRKRTVILAVVSASTEIVNQVITGLAAKADPQKKRTIGILTKIDTVNDDDREDELIKTLQNEVVPLKLGWYGLVNAVKGKKQSSAEDVDAAERTFFSHPRFQAVPNERLGIGAFRTNVTKVVAGELYEAIPAVQEDATLHLQRSQKALEDLGDPRSEVQQQRYLWQVLTSDFRKNLEFELDSPNSKTSFKDSKHSYLTGNLRKRIETLQVQFTDAMTCHGSSKAFKIGSAFPKAVGTPNPYSDWKVNCQTVELTGALNWVYKAQDAVHAFSMPGKTSDQAFAQLFQDLVARWSVLSIQHLENVRDKCTSAIHDILNDCAGNGCDDVVERIDAWICPAIAQAYNKTKSSITKMKHNLSEVVPSSSDALHAAACEYWEKMKGALNVQHYHGLKGTNALVTLCGVRAYYDRELEIWARNVGNHIFHDFLREIKAVLTQAETKSASDAEVASLVSEPIESVGKREQLTQGIERLKKALDEIRKLDERIEKGEAGDDEE